MLIRIVPDSEGKISWPQFRKMLEFFYLTFSELRIRKGNTDQRWVIEVETTKSRSKK